MTAPAANRACQWCGCSIEHQRRHSKFCNDGTSCKTNYHRKATPPTICAGAGCDDSLAVGRDRRYRHLCSDECLTIAERQGCRLNARARPSRPDPYLTEKREDSGRSWRCECGAPPPAAFTDDAGSLCSACGRHRDGNRVRVEPQSGGPMPLRARPSAAPREAAPSTGGLDTRTGQGVELPKKVRQCAACGALLRKGKRGVCCERCEENPANTKYEPRRKSKPAAKINGHMRKVAGDELRRLVEGSVIPETRPERYDKDRESLERELGAVRSNGDGWGKYKPETTAEDVERAKARDAFRCREAVAA